MWKTTGHELTLVETGSDEDSLVIYYTPYLLNR
jgi:hypothetical protein